MRLAQVALVRHQQVQRAVRVLHVTGQVFESGSSNDYAALLTVVLHGPCTARTYMQAMDGENMCFLATRTTA